MTSMPRGSAGLGPQVAPCEFNVAIFGKLPAPNLLLNCSFESRAMQMVSVKAFLR
jgi:hypothetical protein